MSLSYDIVTHLSGLYEYPHRVNFESKIIEVLAFFANLAPSITRSSFLLCLFTRTNKDEDSMNTFTIEGRDEEGRDNSSFFSLYMHDKEWEHK